MVAWDDPARIQSDAAIFAKLLMVLLGLYIWEVLITFRYDWAIITGQRKFKYPTVFYFVCRYSLLLALIGINVSLNATSKLNCQALYTINQFLGNAAIATASTLLMLRAVAIWSRNLWVMVPLGVLGLGQWGILLHGVVTVRASWSDELHTCLVTGTLPVFLNLIYIYTMSYDLIVLVVSCTGLVITANRSDLWELLFRDGIVYFVVAFVANLIPSIFLLLNLNPAMNIMTTVPACVATTVVATRGFVRLSTWARKDPSLLPSHISGNSRPKTGAGLDGLPPIDTGLHRNGSIGKNSKEGVSVAMESYSVSSPRGASPYPGDKAVERDSDTAYSSDNDTESGAVTYTRSQLGTSGPTSPAKTTKFYNVSDYKDPNH